MNRVDKTIGWCKWTVNPIKGLCPMGCSYCYARRFYKRMQWDETIRFDINVLDKASKALSRLPDGQRVFVGSTMELFGDHIKREWLEATFKRIRFHSQHTFLMLTKCPQNLPQWSPFPDNCHIGVTATNDTEFIKAGGYLELVNAKVKYISVEPFLSWDTVKSGFMATMLKKWGIGLIIIGRQTPISKKTEPKIEWIQEIVEAADKAGVPVFLKDNLTNLFKSEFDKHGWTAIKRFHTPDWELRQEFPKVK